MEAIWTVDELDDLGSNLKDLQDRLQEWESESGVKIADFQLTLETVDRPIKPIGLVTLRDKGDTLLQYEPLEAELSFA